MLCLPRVGIHSAQRGGHSYKANSVEAIALPDEAIFTAEVGLEGERARDRPRFLLCAPTQADISTRITSAARSVEPKLQPPEKGAYKTGLLLSRLRR